MKITNIAVSVELNDLLMTHAVFQGTDDYKMVAPCEHLLYQIYSTCNAFKTDYTAISSVWIQDLFRAYTTSYKPILEALRELDLLVVEGVPYPINWITGKANQFKVTPKAISMLESTVTENLRKIHNDPVTKKKVKKAKRNKRHRLKPTDDYAVDNMNVNLLDLEYDVEKLDEIRKALTKEQNNHVNCSLLNLHTLNYENERGEVDGRIHSLWVLMNSSVRPAFYIKQDKVKYFYTHTIDLRACHPTFWGNYILNSYNNSSLSHTTTYVMENETLLDSEYKKWVTMWTDEAIDPRDVIAKDTGKSKEDIKKLLNTALNDWKWDNALKQWIHSNFPHMYEIWQKTDVDKTGCNISRDFETQLMLSAKLYIYLHGIKGIRIMGEHDGIGVFSDPTDKAIEEKLEGIVKFLKNHCQVLFGIVPVIKIESLASEAPAIIHKMPSSAFDDVFGVSGWSKEPAQCNLFELRSVLKGAVQVTNRPKFIKFMFHSMTGEGSQFTQKEREAIKTEMFSQN